MDKVTNKSITSNKATLQKKAKKKFVSKGIAYQLYYENPDSPIRKSYQNTIYCANTFFPNKSATALITHYCKNRWCLTCGAIRTATLINGYFSQFKEFKNPQFVTLTNVSVTAEELPQRIKDFGKSFRQIIDAYSARSMNLKGLRKAECTISKGMYHYHFHVIIDGKENAEYLMKHWLRLNPDSKRKAQDIRSVDDNSMLELFKYTTKLLAKDPMTGKREFMDVVRLDVIFQALRNKRTFQPFGGVKPVNEDITEELKPDIMLTADMVFKWQYQDWVNEESGECLSGYIATDTIKELFKLK